MKELSPLTDSLSDEELHVIEQSVEKNAIEQLFRNGLRAVLFNIVNPCILAIIFLMQTSHSYIYIWLALLILVSALRYMHILNRLPQLAAAETVKPDYATEFIAAASISGLLWGIGFFMLSPLLSMVNQVIFLLVLAGMVAGAYASMSSHRLCYASYLLCMFLPVILSLLTTSNMAVPGDMFSLFIIVFVAMLLITHKQSNTIILNSIRSEMIKNLLIEKIQASETGNN